MTTTVTLLGTIWLFCFVCSICAISFQFLMPRHSWPALFMALAAALISVMGISGRTPFGRLPDIAWSWTNDSFLISVRLGWTFIVPLVLAIVGLAMLLVRKRSGLYGA
jgi:hypothetical protein